MVSVLVSQMRDLISTEHWKGLPVHYWNHAGSEVSVVKLRAPLKLHLGYSPAYCLTPNLRVTSSVSNW